MNESQKLEREVRNAYEAAARIYCNRIGADPDAQVPDPEQMILGVQKTVPVWHGVAYELHNLSMMLGALKEAAATPKVVLN